MPTPRCLQDGRGIAGTSSSANFHHRVASSRPPSSHLPHISLSKTMHMINKGSRTSRLCVRSGPREYVHLLWVGNHFESQPARGRLGFEQGLCRSWMQEKLIIRPSHCMFTRTGSCTSGRGVCVTFHILRAFSQGKFVSFSAIGGFFNAVIIIRLSAQPWGPRQDSHPYKSLGILLMPMLVDSCSHVGVIHKPMI
jgi:hypothetical protein